MTVKHTRTRPIRILSTMMVGVVGVAVYGAVLLLDGDNVETPGVGQTAGAAEKPPVVERQQKSEPDLTPVLRQAIFQNILPVIIPNTVRAAGAKKPTVAELRKQYPFRPLSRRLAYESRLSKRRPRPKLSKASAKRLDDADRWNKNVMVIRRKQSLAMLHSAKAEEFVKRNGFGLSRMLPPVSPGYLPTPTAPPIPLAAAPIPTSEEGSAEIVLLPATDAPSTVNPYRLPSQSRMLGLHFGSRGNFLNPSGLGFVKDREHVAGFTSHKFFYMPQLPNPKQKQQAGAEKWQIRRLELVSLLKHDRPLVYMSEHLPRLDDLSDAKTRLLTDQESHGLKQLRDGEDMAVNATPNVIRMMGSLRASKQCLECHSVQRGELLGAFSYELRRDPPIQVPRRSAL